MNLSLLVLILTICFLSNSEALPQRPGSCKAYNETCCLNEDCCNNGCCFEQRCVPHSCEICERTPNPCDSILCIYGTYCYVKLCEPCKRPPCPCIPYCK